MSGGGAMIATMSVRIEASLSFDDADPRGHDSLPEGLDAHGGEPLESSSRPVTSSTSSPEEDDDGYGSDAIFPLKRASTMITEEEDRRLRDRLRRHAEALERRRAAEAGIWRTYSLTTAAAAPNLAGGMGGPHAHYHHHPQTHHRHRQQRFSDGSGPPVMLPSTLDGSYRRVRPLSQIDSGESPTPTPLAPLPKIDSEESPLAGRWDDDSGSGSGSGSGSDTDDSVEDYDLQDGGDGRNGDAGEFDDDDSDDDYEGRGGGEPPHRPKASSAEKTRRPGKTTDDDDDYDNDSESSAHKSEECDLVGNLDESTEGCSNRPRGGRRRSAGGRRAFDDADRRESFMTHITECTEYSSGSGPNHRGSRRSSRNSWLSSDYDSDDADAGVGVVSGLDLDGYGRRLSDLAVGGARSPPAPGSRRESGGGVSLASTGRRGSVESGGGGFYSRRDSSDAAALSPPPKPTALITTATDTLTPGAGYEIDISPSKSSSSPPPPPQQQSREQQPQQFSCGQSTTSKNTKDSSHESVQFGELHRSLFPIESISNFGLKDRKDLLGHSSGSLGFNNSGGNLAFGSDDEKVCERQERLRSISPADPHLPAAMMTTAMTPVRGDKVKDLAEGEVIIEQQDGQPQQGPPRTPELKDQAEGEGNDDMEDAEVAKATGGAAGRLRSAASKIFSSTPKISNGKKSGGGDRRQSGREKKSNRKKKEKRRRNRLVMRRASNEDTAHAQRGQHGHGHLDMCHESGFELDLVVPSDIDSSFHSRASNVNVDGLSLSRHSLGPPNFLDASYHSRGGAGPTRQGSGNNFMDASYHSRGGGPIRQGSGNNFMDASYHSRGGGNNLLDSSYHSRGGGGGGNNFLDGSCHSRGGRFRPPSRLRRTSGGAGGMRRSGSHLRLCSPTVLGRGASHVSTFSDDTSVDTSFHSRGGAFLDFSIHDYTGVMPEIKRSLSDTDLVSLAEGDQEGGSGSQEAGVDQEGLGTDQILCSAPNGDPFLILGASDESCAPHVLSPPLMEALQSHLPFAVSGQNFWLKYSMVRDGADLRTLLDNVPADSHTVLAIETEEGEVFGSFTSTPWRRDWNYYGSGFGAFLWRMKCSRSSSPSSSGAGSRTASSSPKRSVFDRIKAEGDIDVYKWSGRNDYTQLCTSDKIAVGGSGAEKVADWVLDENTGLPDPRCTAAPGFGLCVDEDMYQGTSSPCATFDSPPLSESRRDGSPFNILNVEVWALTPCISVEEALKMEVMKTFRADVKSGGGNWSGTS